MSQFAWLPKLADWQKKFAQLQPDSAPSTWERLGELARARLDFTETLRLDRALQKRFAEKPPEGLATKPVRLAVLGSATVGQLLPGVRIGALRRNIWTNIYTADYGQYLQELLDLHSPLHRFKPSAILYAFEATHFLGLQSPVADKISAPEILDDVFAKLRTIWKKAKDNFGCQVIQQTFLPTALPLLGQNEQRLPHSLHRLISQLNQRLRMEADAEGVDLLALDDRIAVDGLHAWHDPLLWHKAKQEITPLAGPLYGDLVARLLAAAQGRSAKCLVLDLDNTLWGGVIGDDGLEGIQLGQGSPQGEAFLAFQRYALGLSRRGIILAVCSKNDEANALLPFEQHPEMILKRSDIACFVANWDDKAANLREVARRLSIGLDALVFADDNPFERNIVRQELPMVAVPELPDDPALFPQIISDAGYFESIHVTHDDLERTHQYQANLQREQLNESTTDMEGYLNSLQMEMHWSPFKRVDLQRVVQLINKTNQFNLTTRRYTDAEIGKLLDDPKILTLQLRLLDRFGDNGIIGIVIARPGEKNRLIIDTWLMSCRVLGRGVERATLALVCEEARRLGAEELIGEFYPTPKNGMVGDHYAKLGFAEIGKLQDGGTRWKLNLADFAAPSNSISLKHV